MSSLVTGASGFLGAYLARTLLASGEEVRALRRPASDLSLLGDDADRIDWFESDVLDPLGLGEALQGVDTVYHCAAMVSFSPRYREEMIRVNAEGTAMLIDASLEAGIKSFCHVSSVAAIGRKKGQSSIDERFAWEYNKLSTDYALSKHMAEREAWRGWAEGLNVLIVNPGTIMGAAYWDRGTARFFSRADESLRFYTSGGTGFVDVRDVARACILLVRKAVYGERFILVAENLRYKELFDEICRQLERPLPGLHAGKFLLEAVWRWEALKSKFSGKPPDLTRQNAKVIANAYQYQNSKVLKTLNMDFNSIRQCIAETALEYRRSRQAGRNFGILPVHPV